MERILIVSRRAQKKVDALRAEGYVVVDVTSKAENETWRRFSPFYPHGNIPVPGMIGHVGQSVEGIWQGLKVFEHEGADLKKLKTRSMVGLKRPVTEKRGRVLGHTWRDGGEVLGYVEARKRIYLPAYDHVLESHLQNELTLLRGLLHESQKGLVLLDYETNEDVEDTHRPLAHASLIKRALVRMIAP